MSKLKIHFESDQEHQVRAIESTVNLFNGFTKREVDFQMGDDTIPNIGPHEMLDESWLYDNLLEVQAENGLIQDFQLDFDDGFELYGIDSWRYPYYTCEMETGTGKTYVYLRTIHELRKNYGWGKFIIIVPSVAIYEGVLKTFEITKEHFQTLYGNETINLIPYSGQRLNKLRHFASSSTIEILLMTIDSFNTYNGNQNDNLIYKPTEKLQGERLPFQYIQETRPILILDESQNYTSELSRQALRTLHPLFALKYSATPTERGVTPEKNRELMNRFYHLSPVDAFKMNLVKKIEVLGVTQEYNANDDQMSFRFVEGGVGYGPAIEAELQVVKNGEASRDTIKLKGGENLYEKTGNEKYQGMVVENIDKRNNLIVISGEEFNVVEGGDLNLSKEEIFRIQIEETIKAHMIKQKQVIGKGVKVLSLFFIDKVANYVESEGVIKRLFDEAYEKLKHQYPYFAGWRSEDVREGYFAKKTFKSKPDEIVETKIEKKTKADKEAEKIAYELIMKNKEKLLSFDEKVSFIFCHSALKEGWDNPNVFQICTLNTAVTDRRKRQEIGRGLRIAVDQKGRRVNDEGLNVLTVVANESYEDYCEQLQSDYRESGDVAPPAPSNARKVASRRNDKLYASQAFKDFWKKLCQKTEYEINVEIEELKKICIAKLNAVKFPEPNIVVVKGRFIITTFMLELIGVINSQIRLRITVTDTNNNEDVYTRNFKKGDDIARITGDARFKGFKIVDLKEDGEHSEIYFGDRGTLRMGESITFTSEKGQKGDPQSRQQAQTTYPVFNFIKRAEEVTHLKKTTLVEMFKGMKEEQKEKIFKNPEGFSSIFIETVKNSLADHIADNIEYTLTEELMDYDPDEVFPDSRKFPQKELVDGADWSLYDQVQIDSDIERNFVMNKLNEDDDVICYFKFPYQFKISLPKIIGNYNPDWGIIRYDENKQFKLELVRETKGNVNPNLLQFPNEKRKIDCATKHFEQTGIDYKQIKGDEVKWW